MRNINMLGMLDMKGNETIRRVYGVDGIAPTLTTSQGGHRQPKILVSGSESMELLETNDFFCGAGGLGIGFKQAGFKIAGAWDYDKFAIEAYKHNVGDHAKQADITEMTWRDVTRADMWTFGFPCVTFSVAGLKMGMIFECTKCGYEETFEGELIIDGKTGCTKCGSYSKPKDPRGLLFFEVMRLLKETEMNNPDNMPKMIMAENVKGVRPYLDVIEGEYKKRGYKMYAVLYNSKFWGVPQNRERYFIMGVHESIDKEFIFPEQQELYVPRLSSILETDVDSKYYISDEKAARVIEEAKQKVEVGKAHACLTPDRPKRQNGPRAKANEMEMFTLTAQDRHGVITTSEEGGYSVRKLTPREYARLQGFPEDFEIVVSDSQAYKQFGNAVTVTVSRSLAERVKMFLQSL
ncbi:DNA methyltransferase [Bacillus phage Eldridge]|uniref:DNA methyltransferase n=1 Tax=Bacillus phage Eldridge TaxID=1776293 RepID=A0A120HUM8_9CAUD|nr:DNA methyltransferase [Bacillus phage Eldridge]AMB18608.1 DNA methyltransferase [Bacillus phage Eldridge]